MMLWYILDVCSFSRCQVLWFARFFVSLQSLWLRELRWLQTAACPPLFFVFLPHLHRARLVEPYSIEAWAVRNTPWESTIQFIHILL